MGDGKGDIMVRNTPPSLPPFLALPSIPMWEGRRAGGKEESGVKEEGGGGRYLCFAVRSN